MLRYWDTIYEAFFTMSALRLSLPLPINHSNPKLKTLDANIAPAKDRRTSTPLPHVIWGMQRKIVVSADLLSCGTFHGMAFKTSVMYAKSCYRHIAAIGFSQDKEKRCQDTRPFKICEKPDTTQATHKAHRRPHQHKKT